MRLYHVLMSGVLLMVPLSGSAETASSGNDPDLKTFIIGGQQASANQLPFFARLILHRTGSSQFANICGGTIVNDRYIMTAAHCVESDVFTDGWTINDLRVLVKNPTMDDVFVEEFKDVRSITIHPDYNASDLWINDIAILELTRPITDNVNPSLCHRTLVTTVTGQFSKSLGLAKPQPTMRQDRIICAGQKSNLLQTRNVPHWFQVLTHKKVCVPTAFQTELTQGYVAAIQAAR